MQYRSKVLLVLGYSLLLFQCSNETPYIFLINPEIFIKALAETCLLILRKTRFFINFDTLALTDIDAADENLLE